MRSRAPTADGRGRGPRAESREPRAESRKSKVESRESRVEAWRSDRASVMPGSTALGLRLRWVAVALDHCKRNPARADMRFEQGEWVWPSSCSE